MNWTFKYLAMEACARRLHDVGCFDAWDKQRHVHTQTTLHLVALLHWTCAFLNVAKDDGCNLLVKIAGAQATAERLQDALENTLAGNYGLLFLKLNAVQQRLLTRICKYTATLQQLNQAVRDASWPQPSAPHDWLEPCLFP